MNIRFYKIKRLFVYIFVIMTVALAAGSIKISAAENKAEAKKARIELEFTDGTKMTWQKGDAKLDISDKELAYVYFGEYPQTEIQGKKLKKSIINAKYDSNGVATVKGIKYKRITKKNASVVHNYDLVHYYNWGGKEYAYFKIEPIKWRVLEKADKTVLLLSEYAIDDHRYQDWEEVYINWERCTLRNWLNSTFYNSVFKASERKMIKKVLLENKDNYDVSGGNDTEDKVFLLAIEDLLKPEYGFSAVGKDMDINRRCSSTDYAKAMGAYTESSDAENCKTTEGKWASKWWLRSVGGGDGGAATVTVYGKNTGFGQWANISNTTVRPSIYLNLKSVIRR